MSIAESALAFQTGTGQNAFDLTQITSSRTTRPLPQRSSPRFHNDRLDNDRGSARLDAGSLVRRRNRRAHDVCRQTIYRGGTAITPTSYRALSRRAAKGG
jgi:hypothetical protein